MCRRDNRDYEQNDIATKKAFEEKKRRSKNTNL